MDVSSTGKDTDCAVEGSERIEQSELIRQNLFRREGMIRDYTPDSCSCCREVRFWEVALAAVRLSANRNLFRSACKPWLP
jgi:hypothetical protein